MRRLTRQGVPGRLAPPVRAVWLRALFFTAAMGVLGSCTGETSSDVVVDEPSATSGSAEDSRWWRDATAETGLDFVHHNGAAGDFFISEILGAGGALYDHDSDGDLDLYLVQGGLPPDADAAQTPGERSGPSDRLYRNDLEIDADGSARVRFVDITESAGIAAARGHGMGVATGDVDGDGRWDLYLANLGPNQLLVADGRGGYRDATRDAAVDDPAWSTVALFADLDLDGHHDLFVGNYLDFVPRRHVSCTTATGRQDWCGPQSYAPTPDRLFRNLGDGRFEDVTQSAGLSAARTAALGAVTLDVSFGGGSGGVPDGRPDLYVASDGLPNVLWQQVSAGGSETLAFVDEALPGGLAVNARGRAEASMGIALGDLDRDADLDLIVGHLKGETDTVYRNDGALFSEATDRLVSGSPSLPDTTFGIALIDADLDGWLDLFATHGAIRRTEDVDIADLPADAEDAERALASLRQRDRFLRGGPDGFVDLQDELQPLLERPAIGRGLIVGDLDNDGDEDLVITRNGGAARVLLAEPPASATWLGLRVLEPAPNPRGDTVALRDALGATVDLDEPELPPGRYRVTTDGSYASAHDPRVVIGLGDWPHDRPVAVVVRWPDGTRERFRGLHPGRYHDLVHPRVRAEEPPSSETAGPR